NREWSRSLASAAGSERDVVVFVRVLLANLSMLRVYGLARPLVAGEPKSQTPDTGNALNVVLADCWNLVLEGMRRGGATRQDVCGRGLLKPEFGRHAGEVRGVGPQHAEALRLGAIAARPHHGFG